MSRAELPITYKERIEGFREAIQIKTRRINLLSLARLVDLIGFVWILVLGIGRGALLYYLAALLLLILFFSLISIFNKLKEQRELLKQLKLLNERELACLDHDFQDFPDGSEFADTSHPWSHDLDIFGTGSLFQYMNRSSTLEGKRQLSTLLCTEPPSARSVIERQAVIADLRDRIDLRQNFTATGHLIDEKPGDLEDLSRWLKSTVYISKYPWLLYLALGLGLLSLLIIVAGIFDPFRYMYLLFLFVLNLLILSPFLLRTQKYQAVISRKHELLKGYSGLLKVLGNSSLENPDLAERCRRAGRGTREVARLSGLLQLFDQRISMLLGLLLNGLFLFDFIMLHLLEQWKIRNRSDIPDWIDIIGYMDAMISLGGFAWNHPDFTIPALDAKGEALELKGIGHPLIPAPKRVSNDLEVRSEEVVVVTGANMAGKSTFLRTLGVNMILAYMGCPVCATTFRSRFVGLHSSMRTADSLKDEESYFLAEIRKLEQIVLEMESGKPVLILLDEVLKGTNTTDKKLGSVGLIRKCIRYPVCCFIATHDLSLGELEKEYPGHVINYCFESYIQDMELSFDYTIRPGIASSMNASFLMKKMGIVD